MARWEHLTWHISALTYLCTAYVNFVNSAKSISNDLLLLPCMISSSSGSLSIIVWFELLVCVYVCMLDDLSSPKMQGTMTKLVYISNTHIHNTYNHMYVCVNLHLILNKIWHSHWTYSYFVSFAFIYLHVQVSFIFLLLHFLYVFVLVFFFVRILLNLQNCNSF